MIIQIDRAWNKKGYTISRVFINGERLGDGKKWCSSLEDEDRGLHSGMSLDERSMARLPYLKACMR